MFFASASRSARLTSLSSLINRVISDLTLSAISGSSHSVRAAGVDMPPYVRPALRRALGGLFGMRLAERFAVQDLLPRPAEAAHADYRLAVFDGLDRLRPEIPLIHFETRFLLLEHQVLVVQAGEVIRPFTLPPVPAAALKHRGIEPT